MQGRLILVGGGARSGKSAFALRLAQGLGMRCAFVATAEARDQEMALRIRAHQKQRGEAFETFEAPLRLPATLGELAGFDAVLIDCLTLWISNLLLRGQAEAEVLEHVSQLATAVAGVMCPVIVVSNEVGMGLVPETPLGRVFRDLSGRAHQRLARQADELYFAAMGVVLRLRPGPVQVMESGHGEISDS